MVMVNYSQCQIQSIVKISIPKAGSMSDREGTRLQYNRIYPQPAHTHKCLQVHKRFAPSTNFHKVYHFRIVYVTDMKLIPLIFCD